MIQCSTMFEQAQRIATTDKQAGINMFQEIIGTEDGDVKNEEQIRVKEQSILELGLLFSHTNRAVELGSLIKTIRSFLSLVSRAKASKLVRSLVDLFLNMKADTGMELEVCEECIAWAKAEKRVFLRQTLEVRLVSLLYDAKYYLKALQLSHTLIKELKKLEDKVLLVETYLLESKIYYGLENLNKAKFSLTSAKIVATTMYCQPKLQGDLDLQSGILQAAADHDFKTAYSYFYEAFEGYDSCDSPEALHALKYMLLCKIMMNTPEEIENIIAKKDALKYVNKDIEAMKAIAEATRNNSLNEFAIALVKYDDEINNDYVIRVHLDDLRDIMFERNLLKIVLPYSKVQIEFIADKIGLDQNKVEKKLSQMVLDKKIQGILDQENGTFIVIDELPACSTYSAGLETITYLGKLVDTLYLKATKLSS